MVEIDRLSRINIKVTSHGSKPIGNTAIAGGLRCHHVAARVDLPLPEPPAIAKTWFILCRPMLREMTSTREVHAAVLGLERFANAALFRRGVHVAASTVLPLAIRLVTRHTHCSRQLPNQQALLQL